MTKVSALFYYPLKSGYRQSANELEIVTTGFRHDREWMLVHPDGNFISQRSTPKLATVRAEVSSHGLSLSFDETRLDLPLYPQGEATKTVQIFGQDIEAIDYGNEIADLMSAYLDKPCRLVKMKQGHQRPVTSSKRAQEDAVSFADGYPFLLTSTRSLQDLNSKMKEPVEMTRFRPNIVIDGLNGAFAEDNWKHIRIGKAEFLSPKVCTRCAITTVDQETGLKSRGEPLKTLATYRMGEKRVLFGMNLQHVKGSATNVRVGDPLEVLE